MRTTGGKHPEPTHRPQRPAERTGGRPAQKKAQAAGRAEGDCGAGGEAVWNGG